MKGWNRSLRELSLTLTLVLPWLFTFTAAPSPSVAQWLLSAACGVLIWLMRAGLTAEQVLHAWLLAATANAIVALMQYAGSAHLLAPWAATAGQGQAFGQLSQRNHFATLSSIGMAALMWLPSLGVANPPRTRNWMLVLAGLLGAANAATSSRTGLVELLFLGGLVTLWGLSRTHVARVFLVAIAAYFAATFALPLLFTPQDEQSGIWTRMQQGGDACSSRLALWRNVLELIELKPWSGWGWGELDYAHFITLFEGTRFCAILDNAHNLPLQIAVELGLPSALLMCVLAWLGLRSARPWVTREGRRQVGWAVLGLLLLHSMVEYPLWYGPFQLTMLLSFWLLAMPHKSDAGQGVAGSRRNWANLLGLIPLIGLAYTAWDYHRISQIYLPPEQRAPAYRENTLEKIRDSWLFRDQVRFAEYAITPLTLDNAERLYAMGLQVLHFSPEAKVVEKLIECAVMLGRFEEARFYLLRYKAAYPQEHARWAADRVTVRQLD